MIGRWARESWVELRRHRLRSLLTAVGVAIAVTAFTLIAQVGELARRSISEELAGFEGLPGTVQLTVEVPSGVDAGGQAELQEMIAERFERYDATTVAMAIGAGPVVVGTDGEPLPAKEWEERCGPAGGDGRPSEGGRSYVFEDGQMIRSPCQTDVFGAGAGLRRVMGASMVAGRWFEDSDDGSLAMAVVLSKEMAAALVDVDHPTPESLVGSTLHPEGDGLPLVVVGVVAENAVTRQLGYPGSMFVAPKVAARLAAANAAAAAQGSGTQRFDGRPAGSFAMRAFALVPPDEADAIGAVVANETTQYLHRRGMTDASASSHRVDQSGQLAKAMRILNSVLFGIASMTMVVGALFVLIITLTSLRQRVQELGVRRAVGARPGDLALLLLLESTVVALVGGVAGVAGAWVISKAVVAFTSIEETVQITSPPLRPLLFGMLVAAGTGMLAGLIPAWRAARLSVLDALRR